MDRAFGPHAGGDFEMGARGSYTSRKARVNAVRNTAVPGTRAWQAGSSRDFQAAGNAAAGGDKKYITGDFSCPGFWCRFLAEFYGYRCQKPQKYSRQQKRQDRADERSGCQWEVAGQYW